MMNYYGGIAAGAGMGGGGMTAGMGGPLNGAMGASRGGGFMDMPMGGNRFMMNNNLNTIEEEKHETQTSNYFKDGESEESKISINKQSRILTGLDDTQNKKNDGEGDDELQEGEESYEEDFDEKKDQEVNEDIDDEVSPRIETEGNNIDQLKSMNDLKSVTDEEYEENKNDTDHEF